MTNQQDVSAQARLARLLAVLSLFQALGGGWQLPPEPVPPNVTPASVVVPAAH